MKPELIVAEKVFLNRSIFREADRHYASAVEQVANATQTIVDSHCNKITDEVNKIKAQIKAQIADTLKSAVEGDDSKDEKATIGVSDLVSRLSLVECENKKLRDIIKNMESRLDTIEGQSAKKTTASSPSASPAPVSAPAPAQASITETATPVKVVTTSSTPAPASVPVAAETTAKKSGKGKNKKNKNKDKKGSPQPEPVKAAVAPVPVPAPVVPATKQDDDDFDLFDSDEEEEDSEEKKRITEERLAAYAAKKSKKPTVVAKSSILLDIKPWDDETNMAELEAKVRTISMDGLVWGQSKLIPVAFGVKKCQIGCVVEDDKVSTEVLEEEILAFEDYCQSVDIASFNKV